jgi:hypothetical protein
MKRICQNCQYYREGKWCSNFVSEHYRYAMAVDVFVHPENTCGQFAEYGKKAPLWMRVFNKIMRGRQQ